MSDETSIGQSGKGLGNRPKESGLGPVRIGAQGDKELRQGREEPA